MSTEEQELLLRAKDGDKAAFDEIVARYYDKIYRYLRRLVSSNEVAEDLLQDTFLKLYDMLKTYTPTGKASALIYMMAHNTAKNWYEKQATRKRLFPMKRQRAPKAGEDGKDPLDYVKDERFRPDLITEGKESVSETIAAVNELPRAYREVLFLVCVEGVSQEDAAEVLGLSNSALRMKLTRAKRLLAKKMWRRR